MDEEEKKACEEQKVPDCIQIRPDWSDKSRSNIDDYESADVRVTKVFVGFKFTIEFDDSLPRISFFSLAFAFFFFGGQLTKSANGVASNSHSIIFMQMRD